MLVFASVWAMASKFIFAVGRKHVFNPAAFGVVLPALLLDQPATWWVGGNLPLLPFVLARRLLLVRKLQRFDLVATFILVDLATRSRHHRAVADTARRSPRRSLYSPLFFFAFVMLTEPLTAPTMRWPRLAFAALVGFLFVAERPHRLLLPHAGAGAPRRQSLRLRGRARRAASC